MPLPNYDPKTPWIPKSWNKIYAGYTYHSAWYSGDVQMLQAVHGARIGPSPINAFWAKAEDTVDYITKIHIPVAGDIAGASADLLFGETPEVIISEAEGMENTPEATKTQERLDEIIKDGGVANRLLEAGETCAGLGGVFLKVVWDKAVAPYPILAVVQVDAAIPEFKWGILTAVTFWRVIKTDNGIYYRHLERHEIGRIYNGLYKGTKDELGKQIGLTNSLETANLQDIEITGIDDLLVRYVPNMRPNRVHRGSAVGQSDYAGAEALMNALDETFTSWMRDIRLGRGRVIVPDTYLDWDDKGQNPTFNVDKEIFTAISADPMTSDKAGITINQFAIRMGEHRDTALELLDRIVTHAGYSPQTFGLKMEGRAESGTALNIRERRTFSTKAKKERYWKTALEDIFEMMLAIDKLHLGGSASIIKPNVKMSDGIQTDQMTLANTIKLFNDAQALSIDTKVRMIHTDWSEEQIIAEKDAIMAEQGLLEPTPEDLNEIEVGNDDSDIETSPTLVPPNGDDEE